MKSYLSKLGVLLFGAMFAVAGCQDYDEDIRKVNEKIDQSVAQIEVTTDALDAAIKGLQATHAADKAALETALANLKTALQSEIDSDVQKAITDLTAAYQAADAVVKAGYESADAQLKTQLETKINEAKSALVSALTTLESNYKAADEAIKAAYAQADATLKAEINGTIESVKGLINEKVANLQGQINTLDQKINALDAAYKAADSALRNELQAKIDQLKKDLEEADGDLREDLEEEVEALEAADAVLQQNIDKAVQGAATALASAKAELEASLASVKAGLEASIDTLKKRVSANELAIEDLQDAADELNSAIEAEKTARENADTDLDKAIKDEADARAKAVTALATQLAADKKEVLDSIAVHRAAIAAEQAAREKADKELNKALEEAKKDLQDAIDANTDRIEALEDRATALETRVTANETKIKANADAIVALQKADIVLQANIDAAIKKAEDELAAYKADAAKTFETIENVKNLKEELYAHCTQLAENHAKDVTKLHSIIIEKEAALQKLIKANADAIKAEQTAREKADDEIYDTLEETVVLLTEAFLAADEELEEELLDEIAALKTELEEKIAALKTELEEKIQAEAEAREEAVDDLELADEQLALDIEAAFNDAMNALDAACIELNGKIDALINELNAVKDVVNDLVARIQSLVYAPDYVDGWATIDYAVLVATSKTDGEDVHDQILPKLSLLRYKVNAKDAAAEAKALAELWEDNPEILSYTLESVGISRTAVTGDEELVIYNVESKEDDEYLYVWVIAENFPENFYYNEEAYAASLRYSDGNNERATEYTVLIAAESEQNIFVQVKYPDPQATGRYLIDGYFGETHPLSVSDVETELDILEDVTPVFASPEGVEMTEEELAMFPYLEIETEEFEREYFKAEDKKPISDANFNIVEEAEQTQSVQLKEKLTSEYVGDYLVVTREYTFGPAMAWATSTVVLTAEQAKTTILPETPEVDWTLQRAINLRGDDGTPYAKPLTFDSKYTFHYDLDAVLTPAVGKELTQTIYLNGVKVTDDSVQIDLQSFAGEAPNFSVVATLTGYKFPEAGKEPNKYKSVWTSETDELYVEFSFEVTVNPRPKDITVEEEVELELISVTSGQPRFEGKLNLIELAYNELTAEDAAFTSANKVDAMFAALDDAANKPYENIPNYSTNLNFEVEENVDNSFVTLYHEQINKSIPDAEYAMKRIIDTWFGVDFIFDITAKPILPKNSLIGSEDYMQNDKPNTYNEEPGNFVEVFGKINSEGVYTIDLADLGKYFGVTVADGKSAELELEHNLKVQFEIVKGDVLLANTEVAVNPYETPVPEKYSGLYNYAELDNNVAIVDWYSYAETVVDVKATLIAENTYVLDTYDFQLRTDDPLSFEFGDTLKVTRVPGLSANAKIFQNLVVKSSVEPARENLVDQNAPSLKDIFANSMANKTYGIDNVTAKLYGVYSDKAMTIPYSAQKYAWDAENGVLTLKADDGQLLYPIYAKINLSFTHNIHGECTNASDIIVKFEPDENAQLLINKFTNGGDIVLTENLLLTEALVLDNPNAVVTLDLGGKTIQNITREAGSTQYAIRVKQGKLIIRGEGTVDGGSGCLYNIALRVEGSAVAYVEGGYFKVGKDQDGDLNNCVYAADGGQVFISGGKFESAPKKGTVPAEYVTLNLKDNTGAMITCTGGEFVCFNPENNTSEPAAWNAAHPKQFVAEGYKAVLKQYSTTDYEVVAE